MVKFDSEQELNNVFLEEIKSKNSKIKKFFHKNSKKIKVCQEFDVGEFGRCDTVIFDHYVDDNGEDKICIVVIEYKNRDLEPEDIFQLTRYMDGFKRLYSNKFSCEFYVRGILIGTSNHIDSLIHLFPFLKEITILEFKIDFNGIRFNRIAEFDEYETKSKVCSENIKKISSFVEDCLSKSKTKSKVSSSSLSDSKED